MIPNPTLASVRHILFHAMIALLAVCGLAGTASAVPVDISYSAIVTSNGGAEATDGVFPPGTRVTVGVQVDSESLLSGDFLPASGAADSAGVADMSLTVDRAGSGLLIGVPGASARVYSFRGEGPAFEADGFPPSDEIWRWSSANLYLPPADSLDDLLALTLGDLNELIAAFGSMQLMTFTHSTSPNSADFEYAFTSALYAFSIAAAPVPEPPLAALLAVAAAAAVAVRRQAGKSRAQRPCRR